MRVGVVGYSGQKFDHTLGRKLIRQAFDLLARKDDIEMVSGLTNVGIPAIAYEEATRRGWKTVGVACSQALDYDCFPVNEAIIVGQFWGDESEVFLERIDLVIRVGGGLQSRKEADLARLQGKQVIEFELPALVEAMVASRQ
jgi:hypothetical protein